MSNLTFSILHMQRYTLGGHTGKLHVIWNDLGFTADGRKKREEESVRIQRENIIYIYFTTILYMNSFQYLEGQCAVWSSAGSPNQNQRKVLQTHFLHFTNLRMMMRQEHPPEKKERNGEIHWSKKKQRRKSHSEWNVDQNKRVKSSRSKSLGKKTLILNKLSLQD